MRKLAVHGCRHGYTDKAPLKWNATLIAGDLAQEVARLKQQPGQDILVFGSGTLVHVLMQHDLVDEYRLMIFPIVVGSEKHLFKDDVWATLQHMDTKMFSSGVELLTRRRA